VISAAPFEGEHATLALLSAAEQLKKHSSDVSPLLRMLGMFRVQ